MPYVNPQDIREHVRGIGSVGVPQIAELMSNVESFVKMRLNLDPLPPDNEVLTDIIRELTTAKVIADTLNPTSEQLARAEYHRRNGLTMINDVNRDGLVPMSLGSRDVTKEVYNPYTEPFFSAEDFVP
jgi:hypothetical protein